MLLFDVLAINGSTAAVLRSPNLLLAVCSFDPASEVSVNCRSLFQRPTGACSTTTCFLSRMNVGVVMTRRKR